MSTLRRMAVATIIAAGFCSLASTVDAAEKITIMVGGEDKIIYLPVLLAARLGYFSQQGLDVAVVTEPAGVNAEDEMIAGSVQGVVGFYDHTIDLQSKGTEVESLIQFSDVPGEVELVSTSPGTSEKINSLIDFQGKSLGVTGLGSSTDFLTQYLASKVGLDRDDYRLVPVDAGKTFISAMRQHLIVAGMTTDPTAVELLSTGEARVLVDLRTEAGTRDALGDIYPAACLYMPVTWVNAHRDEAGKLVKALVQALRYMHAHSAVQIVDQLPHNFYDGKKALYIAALKSFLPMFTTDGRMPAGGPQAVLRVLSEIMPAVKAADVDLSKTYTAAFVDSAAR
ncbi:MAG: ABC transporter substrate-binding protein [Paraburkholderia sp.]|uniref:ABC transporter substrate-binding protein n=1 Tax=Paraburkholderia sp. TaxID=1926495 RepID=UPI00120AFD34|nr:ABC transporter substrate-binding protein [Paraburkholderia sp.]TAL93809.1 MAG: ABC transporter substrate-binding protein [Paraburkholderia sp.]